MKNGQPEAVNGPEIIILYAMEGILSFSEAPYGDGRSLPLSGTLSSPLGFLVFAQALRSD